MSAPLRRGAAVQVGLERLLEAGPGCAGLVPGARAGLVAHPASVDRHARHAADLLLRSDSFELVRLFGPEHGVRGEAQDMEAVGGAVDSDTGLPVTSLYGTTPESLSPRSGDLADLDVVIYDLQDVGARYYTFVYTLSFVMEAARDAGIPVVVLDRPNPIGGGAVEGPVLDPSLRSFVGRYPVPARHGLTTAELARMFNEAFGIGCDLRVVSLGNWRRRMHWEDTGLPWVPPSPNMPTPDTAQVYPGACLFEGTNLSEGRGTTRPFEIIGAPWLRGAALASALGPAERAGAVLRPMWFRPAFHKHAGRRCGGLQVHVVDRGSFRPFATYLALLREAILEDREAFDWRREPYEFESDRLAIDLLLGQPGLRQMLEGGASAREMEASWEAGLASFLELRRRFLVYPD